MSITIGTQLGSHEITALLGKGGMGEVYRARDTKLKREVAIKILPDEFSRDPDRVSRFQREAEVLASLNHPNIAAIHSLEEANGSRYLVLELVEGETLAERLQRGPIPVEEVLSIAKSICEALEAAHEKGVVHRDLKPANVKITPDGKVKVLDFGLAKALESTPASPNSSNSPTLSMAATNAGVILGTAAYMSPEQAKGRPVDRRTDIFALGCVLYEMLTGRPAFDGEDVPDILSRVLQREPDWTLLPQSLPPRIRELLRLCLEKNAARRRRDAGDVRIDIEETLANPEQQPAISATTAATAKPLWRRAVPWVTAVVFAWPLAVVLAVLWRMTPEVTSPLRLSAELGADVTLDTLRGAAAILSPDGALLAFTGRKTAGERLQLYVRRLDQLKASPLSGTEGAQSPFFYPDGKWIAFFADGKLKKVSVTGGAAVTLADAPNQRGGWWGDDGNIVFSPGIGALFRVSSAGGTPEPLTKLEKLGNDAVAVTHRWPQVLPGGRAVLFTSNTITGNYENASIVVESLVTAERKILQRGGYYGRYLPSGHLMFTHDRTLFVAPFDLKNLELTGQPVPAIEGVTTTSGDGNSQFAFSNDGKAVYLAGNDVGAGQLVYWMDSMGKMTPLRATPGVYFNPRFSPDGRKLAIEVQDKQRDIWVYEWGRDSMPRLTFGPDNRYPVWTPDGRRIAFASSRAGVPNLYWQRADGSTAEAQRLTDSKNQQTPTSWHPSGKFLAFHEIFPQTNFDIMILPIEGDEVSGWKPGKLFAFQAGRDQESYAAFSPDGRWLAYQSNETGRNEVYVRPFPGPGGRWQISTGAGGAPVWSRTKKELFYRTEDQRIMVSAYSVEGDSFRADKPRLWSEGQFTDRGGAYNFDLHPDGQRFAVLKSPENQAGTGPDKVVFIFNFFDQLRRIAPPPKR